MSATEQSVPEQVRDQAEALALAVTSTSMAIDSATFLVHTPEGLQFAAERLAEVKGKAKRLEELRVSIVDPLNKSVKRINDFFRIPAEAYARAERGYKHAILTYQTQEAERVRKEQAKLEERARKEREALQVKAEKAIEAGREERAAELVQRAATVVAPVAQSAAPAVKGLSTRTVWKYRVKDPALVPREYLMLDESKIGKVVAALKADTTIAGIEVYSEQALASGSR